MKFEVRLPSLFWKSFRRDLLKLQKRNEEVLGFIVCRSLELSNDVIRLVPRSYIVPNLEDYLIQTECEVRLSEDFNLRLINDYISEGFIVIHIHSHPGISHPVFSDMDDRDEVNQAKFLKTYYDNRTLISGVFDQNLEKYTFRSWDTDKLRCYYNVDFVVSNLSVRKQEGMSIDEKLDRQKVFGQPFNQKLSALHIGLIGCGGIGSIFIDIMSRLGVKNWTLIDYDKIETTNLNRLTCSYPSDVGKYKVRHYTRHIKKLWGKQSNIKVFMNNIAAKSCKKSLAKCDIIVVATDNEYSRLIAQELAARFVLPLISMGSLIDVTENGEPRLFGRVSIPPQHGNSWSLISEEIVNAVQASMETASQEIRDRLRTEGYLKDVDAPAVYWLNAQVAAFAANLLHKWIINDEAYENGCDFIMDMGDNTIMEVYHEDKVQCIFTSREGDGLFGLGLS